MKLNSFVNLVIQENAQNQGKEVAPPWNSQ
jgi:hypothetical protein